MAKVCHSCGKEPAFGQSRSHSMVATKRRFDPNLQKVRIQENGRPLRAYVCTRCLKSNKVTKAALGGCVGAPRCLSRARCECFDGGIRTATRGRRRALGALPCNSMSSELVPSRRAASRGQLLSGHAAGLQLAEPLVGASEVPRAQRRPDSSAIGESKRSAAQIADA